MRMGEFIDWCVIVSFQLTGFELNASQTFRSWPREMDLTAFEVIAEDVVTKLLVSHDSILKQNLVDLQTDIRFAQQSLMNGVNALRRSCDDFNASTVIDDNFVK